MYCDICEMPTNILFPIERTDYYREVCFECYRACLECEEEEEEKSDG